MTVRHALPFWQALFAIALLAALSTAHARTNVALKANGGSVSASSTNPAYPLVAINNGDRKGDPWNTTGIWSDNTPGTWPDWVQIAFSGPRTIGEVDVFTLQDNYTTPAEPTATMTFALYGLTEYHVQYWTGTAWADVPGGYVTGNNLVWRRFAFAPITTDRIRVLMSAAPDGSARLTEVEVWTVATNVALAANGGAGTASSSLAGYPVSAVNDGERVGATWNTGGLWADNTFGTWPDWVQVNFNGVQTIDSIDVLMLQDGYTTPVEPTPSMTFNTSTGFGLNQFQVQYWDTATAAWVTVPGGSVSANNLVWRRLAFQPVATDRIRVLAEASPDGRARLVEIEAWTALPVNVARAGAVSSSSDQSTYPASAVNNGDRKGDPWNLNGIWADSTRAGT